MSLFESQISAYNGENYHHLTSYILLAFQKRIVKFYAHQPAD